jgi:hypothetical protein
MKPKQFTLAAGDRLIDKLTAAGVLPNNCRRFVIDCEVNEVPTLYFECYGDERLHVALADAEIQVEVPE